MAVAVGRAVRVPGALKKEILIINWFFIYFCHLRLPLRIVELGPGGGEGGQQTQRQEGREETHCVLLLWACFLLRFRPNAEEFFSSLQGEKAGRMRKECCCDKEPATSFVLPCLSGSVHCISRARGWLLLSWTILTLAHPFLYKFNSTRRWCY